MNILGIETSCDETGVALYNGETGQLIERLYSQIELHRKYGGVVPELASRDHVAKAATLIKEVSSEMSRGEIDAIAYTRGPGLMGALLVGASVARGLAWALEKPILGVHHMEGHLLAPMLAENKPSFPFVCLLVSGGHTLLVEVKGVGQYKILGESLDDAVGEAFDKTAKLLGLPYPGGPELAAIAENGVRGRWVFPRPMVRQPGLEFSFSGLKTFALNTVNGIDVINDQDKADIALAFEIAVAETLKIKCKRALDKTGFKCLVVAGGVGANKRLRQTLTALGQDLSVDVFYPPMQYCTDNGAMIAYAGAQRLQAGLVDVDVYDVLPRWSLEDLPPVLR